MILLKISEVGWNFIIAIAGVLIGGLITFLIQKGQHKRDQANRIRQEELEQERYDEEHAPEIRVKERLKNRLKHKDYVERSFIALKKGFGGFNDNEIRRMLTGINAERIIRTDKSEWWYLRDRNEERKERKKKK